MDRDRDGACSARLSARRRGTAIANGSDLRGVRVGSAALPKMAEIVRVQPVHQRRRGAPASTGKALQAHVATEDGDCTGLSDDFGLFRWRDKVRFQRCITHEQRGTGKWQILNPAKATRR
ncbi:hypothetical protein [Lysobacter sp. TAB13]|uniref:hypothetical protein n=1 Tax=Lysobacter sp. TAB13 TaxID=3233065 RepID=UPI003F96F7F7